MPKLCDYFDPLDDAPALVTPPTLAALQDRVIRLVLQAKTHCPQADPEALVTFAANVAVAVEHVLAAHGLPHRMRLPR